MYKWNLCNEAVEIFLNSLAPVKFEWNLRHVIFKQILVIDGWGISSEIALIWMSLDFADDQSTLVQVMAWCRQATSHYLSQCWPRSLSPYGVTRPQWVKTHTFHNLPGPCLNIKIVFPGMVISIIKVRWSWDSCIFKMGVPIPVRKHLLYWDSPQVPSLQNQAVKDYLPWGLSVQASYRCRWTWLMMSEHWFR